MIREEGLAAIEAAMKKVEASLLKVAAFAEERGERDPSSAGLQAYTRELRALEVKLGNRAMIVNLKARLKALEAVLDALKLAGD